MAAPNTSVNTFLMFFGQAEEAMNFYTSIFDRSEITSMSRYGANEVGYEVGNEGAVSRAAFTILGQEYMCFDSLEKHEFTFTPAISLFVKCGSEEEIDRYYGKLAEGGTALMPLSAYPFSKKFGWVQDKFGVSWQLNLQ